MIHQCVETFDQQQEAIKNYWEYYVEDHVKHV